MQLQLHQVCAADHANDAALHDYRQVVNAVHQE
jgi:hypothetical protein